MLYNYNPQSRYVGGDYGIVSIFVVLLTSREIKGRTLRFV
jgi:hypothetical protein